MSNEQPQVHRVERVDDIPVLLATLGKLQVAEILDRHFPSGHRWQGELTFGEVVSVWISYIASQGDHRLCAVQPWAQQHILTLQACLGKSVRGLDFQDDRLADILDHLALDGPWPDVETELNQHTVRVYDLQADCFRIDTTTANSYVEALDELGLFQFGHSKDRDDQPQIKVAMTSLDPLGMPVTTFVVPGNCADDPLYVPQIKKVQQAFGKRGKTFVMDCKGAALSTRAYLAHSGDHYLCPLPETTVSAEDRRVLLQPVWQGRQPLQRVYRRAEDGTDEELVAEGFYVDVPLQATVDGKLISWTERRWLVRSLAYAAGQHEQLDRRLHKAQEQLARLDERKQGKKRLTAEELAVAAEDIIKKQRVEGLLNYRVRTTTKKKKIRRYGDRPARVEQQQEQRLEVWRCEAAIEQAKREMGWRVYAENQRTLKLEAVVWGYRGQYKQENNFARLKGQPLGLTPLYLQYESRVEGLVLLLSVALRLLSVLEWTVRKKLEEKGETLKGLYAGQPGRQAKRPSAELLLRAFRGISMIVVEVVGELTGHVTPLTALHRSLLELWGLPAELYQRLARREMQPARPDQDPLRVPSDSDYLILHFSQPPPI